VSDSAATFLLTIDQARLPGDGMQQRDSIAEALRRVATAVQHGDPVQGGPVYGDNAKPVGAFRHNMPDVFDLLRRAMQATGDEPLRQEIMAAVERWSEGR
jgi:truncated hemoglobin YjbI